MADRVYVAGHKGLVGSAIMRLIAECGREVEVISAPRSELDLTDQRATLDFMRDNKPDVVLHAAATVGGIRANIEHPAKFIADNIFIQANVLDAARQVGVRRIIMISSGCMYPLQAPVPTTEDALLDGRLEPTNEWYAVAKIAGAKMCEAYAMEHGIQSNILVPCNLYGPGDNFDYASSHVIPAMLRKVHEAKAQGQDSVELWGTGKPVREFLYVDDMALACLHAMDGKVGHVLVNVGTGTSNSIGELARMVCDVVGYEGGLNWNGKMDGHPHKTLDSTRLASTGWAAKVGLRQGLERTYEWMLANMGSLRMLDHGASKAAQPA